MQLIDENVDVMNPNDISFVSSGYAPLSVRLVQLAGKSNGWMTLNTTLALLPKPSLEFTQQHDPAPLDIKDAG
jgi:vacuolar protein sorting-associated protein 33A